MTNPTIALNFSPTLAQAEYEAQRYKIILPLEEKGAAPSFTAYKDSKGLATIGAGFLVSAQATEILATILQRNPTEAEISAIETAASGTFATDEAVQTALNAALRKATGNNSLNFSFSNNSAVESAFGLIADSFEKIVNTWLPSIPQSRERLALLSLAYNNITNGVRKSPSLKKAIIEGNRAEAWFQIRYGTNGDKLVGIAKRRFYESSLFGLSADLKNMTEKEAKDTYQLFTKKRAEILTYEKLWGQTPDGVDGTQKDINKRTAIAAVTQDYPGILANANLSASNTPTLYNQLLPARDVFIKWLNTQLPAGETPLVAADWNPAAIAYADPRQTTQTLGATELDGKAKGMDKNLLVGGDGKDFMFGGQGNDLLFGGKGDDLLVGGEGNDTLYGGEGDDLYVIKLNTTGASTDRINDSDGKGRIVVISADDKTYNTVLLEKQGTTNVWKDADGKVTLSHNSPWTLTLADGSVVELGENFDPAAFGMTLVEKATAGNTFNGDYKKKVSGSSYLFDSYGNYTPDGQQANAPDVLQGTAGNDTINGLGGNDGLFGGAGDDLIEGGEGADLLLGGKGRDTLNGGAGNDYIYGSASGGINMFTSTSAVLTPISDPIIDRGFSWAIYRSADGISYHPNKTAGLTTIANDSPTQIDGGAGNDQIRAGSGNDYVNGNDDDDNIMGLAGSDMLLGGTGNDAAWGDGMSLSSTAVEGVSPETQGNDTLDGGLGNDTLTGQGFNDVLMGGAGDDKLWGDDTNAADTPLSTHGNDHLDGGTGNDQLIGGGKEDELLGGSDNDSLWGDDINDKVSIDVHGNDYLDGGDGDDQLIGGGKDDELYGGKANDKLFGDDKQKDVAVSAHGDDYLDGEDGDDQLVGGGKDDELFGGSGNDSLWGDDTNDDVSVDAHGKDYLEGEDGDDQLVGGGKDDELFGGSGNDQLLGDDVQKNVAVSAHGNDYLDGGDGNDTLVGGGQSDELFGGIGNDKLLGDDRQDNVATNAHGNDYLDGEAGDDLLIGGGLADTLLGGEGNDSLQGDDEIAYLANAAHGADLLDGGEGNDFLSGHGGNDTLIGGVGDDWLSGEDQNSTVESAQGSAMIGDDELSGGEGRDTLLGGDGSDTLDGGGGNDYLNGGAGADTYLFGRGSGRDTVYSSATDASIDTISLGAGIVKADTTLVRSGNNLVLSINGTDDQLVIQNYFIKGLDALQFANGTSLSADAVEARIVKSTVNADSLTGYGFADTINGGDGNDTLDGEGGHDRLEGGTGNDSLSGGDGNDTMSGGTGNDLLNGGIGSNTYSFGLGGGLDTIQWYYDSATKLNVLQFKSPIKPEDVIVRILSNNDLVFSIKNRSDKITVQGFFSGAAYNPLQEVHFDASTEVWNAQKITTKALTTVTDGLTANDTLYGTSGGDIIGGVSTYSYIYGGAGNDTLSGGYYMFGGAGNDTYIMSPDQSMDITIGTESSGNRDTLIIPYAFSDASFRRDYSSSTGYPDYLSIRLANSTSTFGANFVSINDFFKSQGPDNTIQEIQFTDKTLTRAEVMQMKESFMQQTEANDRFFGTRANNTVDTQGGNDLITTYEGVDNLRGGAGDDSLYAGQGNDSLDGGDGNDTLDGESGDDRILGGNGNDSLFGRYGRDTLIGDAGNDLLLGYMGSDTYNYGWGQGDDTLFEYNENLSEVDTLVLDAGITEADVSLFRDGNDLVLTLGTTSDRPQLLVRD